MKTGKREHGKTGTMSTTPATCNQQPATCNQQPATCNLQPATCPPGHELLRRREVMALGLSEKLLAACTVVVASAADIDKLPPRTIAAIRLERRDGKRAKLLYFARTVQVLVPH